MDRSPKRSERDLDLGTLDAIGKLSLGAYTLTSVRATAGAREQLLNTLVKDPYGPLTAPIQLTPHGHMG
jgi:hypothetical protein